MLKNIEHSRQENIFNPDIALSMKWWQISKSVRRLAFII